MEKPKASGVRRGESGVKGVGIAWRCLTPSPCASFRGMSELMKSEKNERKIET